MDLCVVVLKRPTFLTASKKHVSPNDSDMQRKMLKAEIRRLEKTVNQTARILALSRRFATRPENVRRRLTLVRRRNDNTKLLQAAQKKLAELEEARAEAQAQAEAAAQIRVARMLTAVREMGLL